MRVRTFDELRASGDAELLAPIIARVRAMPDVAMARAPLFFARAPGRLDVMGGIADYSGSLVLQLPLAVATTVVLWPIEERTIDLLSVHGGRQPRRFSMSLEALLTGELRDPSALAAWFAVREDDRWASYVIGVAHACLVRRDVAEVVRRGGFRMLIESEVPEGKGVSSSAALEVACLSVIAARYGVEMTGEEIATASQWAENHVAGAPCGIMDQMTSACGRRDRLLRLRCQPDIIEGHVEIPAGYRFYGIDSGIRHAVSGSDYGTVRTAAFMGYRIVAAAAGLTARPVAAGRVAIDDHAYDGYLANVPPPVWQRRFRDAVPERLDGAAFLDRYQGTTDVVTAVDPARSYAVRAATEHPIYEHARVMRFRDILAGGAASADARAELGELMFASHASYSACGLGSDGTDRLVELARAAGPAAGIHGAKITGGGSGGTVVVLATAGRRAIIEAIADRYRAETGRQPTVFSNSSDGARAAGLARMTP